MTLRNSRIAGCPRPCSSARPGFLLPDGRPMHLNPHAARNVTLDSCHALQLHLEPRRNEVSRRVIIWRGGRADFRLVGRERLRDVRAGDEVIFQGRSERVVGVEIYR